MSNNNQPNEKHLEFIQTTISRMAQNSFQAKTWCITILSAIIAFYVTQDNDKLKVVSAIAGFVVLLVFWLLDSYYLYLERGYRDLYNIAAKLKRVSPALKPYDMKIQKESRGFKKYVKSLFSLTTGLLYISIIVMLILLVVYI